MMDISEDSLRFCPKCKNATSFDGEAFVACPKCGNKVWFFNYRSLPPPEPCPPRREPRTFGKSLTQQLISLALILSVTALIAIRFHFLFSLIALGLLLCLVVVGFIQHRMIQEIDSAKDHSGKCLAYALAQQARLNDALKRYNAILGTGDARIDYFYTRYVLEAQKLREEARRDREASATVEERIFKMATRLVDDHRKWSTEKLRPNVDSYQRRKSDLQQCFHFVESVGYPLPTKVKTDAFEKLRGDFEAAMRVEALKEEQRRVQQQLRTDEKLRREAEKAVREAEQREAAIEDRLQELLRQHRTEADAEVQKLREQLVEAQTRAERAKSMAQMTKAGHVYILSNIGSFGENVFKVGMTRRLDPEERVKELGDASVPFPFDVHAMISCDNAPGLENALHRELTRFRVNRWNLRKEFFHVELDTIIKIVQQHHGVVEYRAEPEALEYRESERVSPDELVAMKNELDAMGIDMEESDE
jgi:hypothetical protein